MKVEIILNLWYIFDDMGIIYSLRVKPYIMSGTDEEKVQFLKSRASLDYLVATVHPVPKHFKVVCGEKELNLATTYVFDLGQMMSLFGAAIESTEKSLPAQTQLRIPDNTLYVCTPLHADENFNLTPIINNKP